jgi:hypothetical protein
MATRRGAFGLGFTAILALGLAGACASPGKVSETTGTGTTSGHGSTSGAGGSGGSGGSGGAGTTASTGESTTSVTTGSTSSGMSNDPCSGASDGAHCGGDLGGLADHNSLYQCSGGATASAQPCSNGCSNDACVAPPADPCSSAQYGNGAYCGGNLTGGDPNVLYNCQNGSTASKTTCSSGCQQNPPGVADACKTSGDPCAKATSGNGAYCGGSIGGDPNVLYDCQNQVTAGTTTCSAGCQMNPPGVADACKPTNSGACCVDHPPGTLTQPYTACGNGGSHYGIDYGTPVGTPIYAGISGTVVSSALGYPNCYNNGCSSSCWNSFNYVKIKSDCGDPGSSGHDLYIYYLHIDSLAAGIGNGSHVNQGQLVAYSGNSGCSSGPHIHIETVSVPAGQSAVLNTCNSVDPASRYCN